MTVTPVNNTQKYYLRADQCHNSGDDEGCSNSKWSCRGIDDQHNKMPANDTLLSNGVLARQKARGVEIVENESFQRMPRKSNVNQNKKPDDLFMEFENDFEFTIDECKAMGINYKECQLPDKPDKKGDQKNIISKKAFDFANPDKSKALDRFFNYVRDIYGLSNKSVNECPEKVELIDHSLKKMISEMGALTDENRTACIAKSFSNSVFQDALRQALSDVDKSIIENLQGLAAFNFMIIEVNALARDSGISSLEASGADDSDSGKFMPFEQFNNKRLQKKVDIITCENEESREEINKLKEVVEKDEQLNFNGGKMLEDCPSILGIQNMSDDITIVDTILKFVEAFNSEDAKGDLNSFLQDRCAEKSKCIIKDLEQVLRKTMTRCDSVKRFSETVVYRKVAEVIKPPSVRRRTKLFKNKPISDSNAVNGSPVEWTRFQLKEEFRKAFKQHTDQQAMFVYTHSDDFLRLFKLEQYPFKWSYDGMRKATPADKIFGVMAQTLYDRFIGKPGHVPPKESR
ncbi:hypothetical protein [Endozoicomonas sp.]|uniref:hypothetical protein n=1 Tax=Endozoicomonas sp. TaxID=1892382 RepID=UPI00288651DA|nr:hypothetical protein [Endozoicomonas sp.]